MKAICPKFDQFQTRWSRIELKKHLILGGLVTFHATVIYCDMVVSVKDLRLPCLVLLLLATSVNSRGVKQFRSGRISPRWKWIFMGTNLL